MKTTILQREEIQTELEQLRQRVAELEQNKAASDAARRESEELLQFVIKHNPNAIAVFDKDLHYLVVSDRYLQDYGLDNQSIIGRHHYDVFPEMPDRWKEVHQHCLDGAIEASDEDSFVREDGSVTYNRWECRPWYDSHGEIAGMTMFTEVIPERKQAEHELRMFKELVENASDAIAVIRPDSTIILCECGVSADVPLCI